MSQLYFGTKAMMTPSILLIAAIALLAFMLVTEELVVQSIGPETSVMGISQLSITSAQQATISCPSSADFCYVATSNPEFQINSQLVIVDQQAYMKAGASGPTPAGPEFGCLWDVKKNEFLLSRSGMREVVVLFAPNEQYAVKNVCDGEISFAVRSAKYASSVSEAEKYVIPTGAPQKVPAIEIPIGQTPALKVPTTLGELLLARISMFFCSTFGVWC